VRAYFIIDKSFIELYSNLNKMILPDIVQKFAIWGREKRYAILGRDQNFKVRFSQNNIGALFKFLRAH
jgi:hypothetical protein